MGQSGTFRKAAAAAAAAALVAAAPHPRLDPEEKTVRDAVAAQMKDPDSAEFKGVKKTSPGYWCGWVNAKNSFGGYTGYAVFYFHNGNVSIVPPELSEPKLC
jgi:hypothetical protein